MALKFLQTVKEPTGRLARWMLELQQYDFRIHYKKGSLQAVADTLPRNIETDEIAEFREIRDKWYNKRLTEVQENPKKCREWRVVNNMLYKRCTNMDDLIDPVYNKDEGWRLVVPLKYR